MASNPPSNNLFKNSNFLAEPVTFIIVPHRRYTLPFISRNIYIEELASDGNDDLEPGNEGRLEEDAELLPPGFSKKDNMTQVLNNIFASLLGGTKEGLARRGRALRRKLGLQRRSRSAGFPHGFPRDRFHLCPPCRKIQKVKNELARLKGPAIQRIKRFVKPRGNVKPELPEPLETNLEVADTFETPAKPSNPSRFDKTSKCPVIKTLAKLKEHIPVKHFGKKAGNKVIIPKRRQSSFYILDGNEANLETPLLL